MSHKSCPMGICRFFRHYMTKLRFDVVVPAKPLFYKRYSDDRDVQRRLIRSIKFLLSKHQTNVRHQPMNIFECEMIRENGCISVKFLTNQKSFFFTGARKFLINVNVMLLLKNFTEQNKSRQILIKEYIELEKSIDILVFHRIQLMMLSVIQKKKPKKLLQVSGYLKKEKLLQQDFHTHLLMRNSVNHLLRKQRILLIIE